MSNEDKPTSTDRRTFLHGAALTGGAAIAASTLPGVASAASDDAVTATAKPEKKGYRLTSHILDYYKSASV